MFGGVITVFTFSTYVKTVQEMYRGWSQRQPTPPWYR